MTVYLPLTPSLRRLAAEYVGCVPSAWHERRTCAGCNGKCRGYRNDADQFWEEPMPVSHVGIDVAEMARQGFAWWFCTACMAHGYHDIPALPLHVPAALHVARLRLAEVGQEWVARYAEDAEAVARMLREMDPEMREERG